MMRRLVFVLVLTATACGSLVEPFEDVPPVYPPTGVPIEAQRVAVCYNKMFSTPEQVRKVAAQACGPSYEPQFIGQDMKLTCPLMTPVRANFLCAEE